MVKEVHDLLEKLLILYLFFTALCYVERPGFKCKFSQHGQVYCKEVKMLLWQSQMQGQDLPFAVVVSPMHLYIYSPTIN